MRNETLRPPGFYLYLSDWRRALRSFSLMEIGDILESLFIYLETGKEFEYEDRSMQMFYERVRSNIAVQIGNYQERKSRGNENGKEN